jgi:ABC-2 type transport system ATP-binding protein
MLGLIHGDGTTLFDGQLYRALVRPACTVGVVLEAAAVHPRRTARAHLRMLAAAAGIDKRCVNDVLDEVGQVAVAAQPAGQLSLGMSQRLALAAALIGSPRTLILDQPANGLDAHGVAWLRKLLRAVLRSTRSGCAERRVRALPALFSASTNAVQGPCRRH